MSHQVTIVEVREETDELVSYRVRCCGEEQTDSWHTASVHADNHDEELQKHIARVQETHDKKLSWRNRQK